MNDGSGAKPKQPPKTGGRIAASWLSSQVHVAKSAGPADGIE